MCSHIISMSSTIYYKNFMNFGGNFLDSKLNFTSYDESIFLVLWVLWFLIEIPLNFGNCPSSFKLSNKNYIRSDYNSVNSE